MVQINPLFAAYGSCSSDGLGYRWLWCDPKLSVEELAGFYQQLDTRRFGYADELKKLLSDNYYDAGLVTVANDLCVAYRFLHGGCEGARGKFYLAVVFFKRDSLPLIDFLKLLSDPTFTTVKYSHSGIPVVPRRLGPLPTVDLPEFSTSCYRGVNALTQAQAICEKIGTLDRFHILIKGNNDELQVEIKKTLSVPVKINKPDFSSPSSFPRGKPDSNTSIKPTVFSPLASRPSAWPTKRWAYLLATIVLCLALLVLAIILNRIKQDKQSTGKNVPKAADLKAHPKIQDDLVTNSLIRMSSPISTNSPVKSSPYRK